LLKGHKDVVELNVPIETNFDNFEVGFDDIIQTALMRATRTIAVAYAQYALQPYGSLLLAKNLLGAMTRPKFEAVVFDLASSKLNSKTADYIEKLGALPVTKRNLSVTICGFADMAELPRRKEIKKATASDVEPTETTATDDAASIKTLAKVRSLAVRDVLLANGVSQEPLFPLYSNCRNKRWTTLCRDCPITKVDRGSLVEANVARYSVISLRNFHFNSYDHRIQ
jgi:hypothetical protein